MEAQDKAGWDNAFHGRWVKGWAVAHDENYKCFNLSCSGRCWLACIIAQLFKTSWDLWEYRNAILHNVEEGIEAKQLNAEIAQEYQLGFIGLTRTIRRWTQMTQEEVLKLKLRRRWLWLRKIKAARILREKQYESDSALEQLRRGRNLMAQFLRRNVENSGQVGQAQHQRQEQQRMQRITQRLTAQEQAATHAKHTRQLQHRMATWIDSFHSSRR